MLKKECNLTYLCHTEVLPSSSRRCTSRVSHRCHAYTPDTANTHHTVGPASRTYTYNTSRAWEGVCVCVWENRIYANQHIYRTAVKPIISCQLTMCLHFICLHNFSIYTESFVTHVHHSNSEGGKSEYHGERSVNVFPVADTGRDLCLFPNLRQQWIPDRLLVKGHFHLTYFKRFLNYRRGKETSLRHTCERGISGYIQNKHTTILYYFCSIAYFMYSFSMHVLYSNTQITYYIWHFTMCTISESL